MIRNKDNFEISKEIEGYIKNIDLDLANLEKLGSSLLIIGYFNFIFSANLDIEEILGVKSENSQSPELVILTGEILVLKGLIVLWIVAIKRLKEKTSENYLTEINESLNPYKNLADAYFLSVIANIQRVHALNELYLNNLNSNIFV